MLSVTESRLLHSDGMTPTAWRQGSEQVTQNGDICHFCLNGSCF